MQKVQSTLPKGHRHNKKSRKKTITRIHKMTTVVAFFAMIAAVVLFNAVNGNGNSKVYATLNESSESVREDIKPLETEEGNSNQLNLEGLVDGVKSVERYASSKKDFEVEHSFENILAGTSIANTEAMNRISVGQVLRTHTNDLNKYAQELVEENQMPDKDYDALLRIVEAEATGEGMLGKMLVANVVLNRVNDPHFPNTIFDVVWEVNNNVAQFSPTVDGRINTVVISDETRSAVNRVINGADYSKGALFFSARAQANPDAMLWFDGELVQLFSYGEHEFYTLAE
jgi:N-acetylmuramoyl-L-alanine amidase